MSQRISDEDLEQWIEVSKIPLVELLALDLRDARARIAELERLSASQSEAMDMMDRGAL